MYLLHCNVLKRKLILAIPTDFVIYYTFEFCYCIIQFSIKIRKHLLSHLLSDVLTKMHLTNYSTVLTLN